jgi:transposase
MPGGRPNYNTPERMKSFASINPETQCWIWSRRKDRDGYGRFCYKGRESFVHRLSYQFWVGPIQPNNVIMHVCDTPACFNPEHLKQGTASENRQDCVNKGRSTKGSRNGNAKLSLYQVHLIKELYELGMSQDELSDMFNVSRLQIRNIVHNRAWVD